jgi:hypothetical protein
MTSGAIALELNPGGNDSPDSHRLQRRWGGAGQSLPHFGRLVFLNIRRF